MDATHPILTPDSLALFDALAADAGDWSGTPLIECSPAERGNLSDLKRKGLLTTFEHDGDLFAHFDPAGVALGDARGHRLSDVVWS